LSRKNFSPRFANLDKVIAFLSEERRKTGSDSLMKNEVKKVDVYLERLTNKYKSNPSLLFRHAAFYNLYWKVNKAAWQNTTKAIGADPWQIKNLLLLIYIGAMISYNNILKIAAPHYHTHINQSLAS
jgi:hypothetical protein